MKKLLFFASLFFAFQIAVGQEGVRYVRKDTANNAVNTNNKTKIINPEKTIIKDSTSTKTQKNNTTNIQHNSDKTSSKPNINK